MKDGVRRGARLDAFRVGVKPLLELLIGWFAVLASAAAGLRVAWRDDAGPYDYLLPAAVLVLGLWHVFTPLR